MLPPEALAELEAKAHAGSASCEDRARLAAHYLDVQLETHDRWLPQLDEQFVSLATNCSDFDQTCLLEFMNPSVALVETWKTQTRADPTDDKVQDNAALVEHQAKRNEEMRTDPRRFHQLGPLARDALANAQAKRAAGYAMQALLHLPMVKKDWNTGNLIFDAHMVLGNVAFQSGDLVSAKRHLLAAGRTPGSPQLSTYGPEMDLAIDLLAAGERDAVIEYLELCKRFWQSAGSRLDEWQREIRSGEPSTMPRTRR